MQDYHGNSKKKKAAIGKEEKPKVLARVTSDDVVVQKKSLGRKAKDLFIEADFKGVIHYVAVDVLLPAARNMIVDASTKGIERMMYGESVRRGRSIHSGGPRITYNNPVSRGFGEPRFAPRVDRNPRGQRKTADDYIISSREEAELVLERMNDIIDNYDVVSVADLCELVGLPASHTDNKWGWGYLGNVPIRQIREGYLIDLPPAEPIQ